MSCKYDNLKIVYGFKSQEIDEDDVIVSVLDGNTKYPGLTVAFLKNSKGYAFCPWYGFECSFCPTNGLIHIDKDSKRNIEKIAKEYWKYHGTKIENRKIEYVIGLGQTGFDFISLSPNIPIWETGKKLCE